MQNTRGAIRTNSPMACWVFALATLIGLAASAAASVPSAASTWSISEVMPMGRAQSARAGPQCALRSGDINGATFAVVMAPAYGGNNASECCDMCYAQYGNASGFNGTGCRSWAYSHVHHGCWLKADPAPTKYPVSAVL
eukprot:COSAG02_NODE_8367_length_2596_cov_13.936724_4_plen_139_part_00